MANSKLKTNSLKRILQSPGGTLGDEELFRLVKKQDRSAESLVLKKFVQAVSEIPLVEYNQSNRTFIFNRHAHRARSYFAFMSYLFGITITTKWPDFKKLTTKITDVNPSHFVSSYCVQTMVQEKITAYNTQMHTLLDYVLKTGKAKEIIYEKIIMEVIVDYFPSVSMNWVWLYNEIVKEQRLKSLVQSGLTIDKAKSQLVKLVKKVAKDCEIEVQRLRVDSSSNTTSTPLNWADVAAAKVSTAGVVNTNPVVTEAIPLASEYFPALQGANGRSLKYIESTTGCKVALGKMRNGQSGFLVTGTREQNDKAIKEVLKLIEGTGSPVKQPTRPPCKPPPQEVVEIITYSRDILDKWITNKDSLTDLGSFSERYSEVIIKVEPDKQRVVVKGKVAGAVKKLTEYLRESLGDFAADLVSKNKKLPSSAKTPDTPVTRPLSAGNKYNAWIHANQQLLLKIALKNHVSLRFPSVKRPSDFLTISGKLQNVEQTDRAILYEIQQLGKATSPPAPEPAKPPPPKTTEVKAPPSHKTGSPEPLQAAAPSNTPLPGSTSRTRVRKGSYSDAIKKEPKATQPVDWFEKEDADLTMESEEAEYSKPADTYEDMELKSTLLSGIYAYGLEKPSTVHSALIPLLLSGNKVLVEADLGEDVCCAILISVLQHVNANLRQTQGFILVRDKLLLPSALGILRSLTTNIPLKSEALLDNSTKLSEVPHIVLSTPQVLKAALDEQTVSGARAKVVVFTDLVLTVGSFGYKILEKKYFNELTIDTNTKLIFQSGEPLPTKVYNLLEKFGEPNSLETIKFGTDEVKGIPKFIPGKKGSSSPEKLTQSRLNNLSERQLEIAKTNLYLVYSVTKGYPELEIIQQEGDIILKGKTADVNTAKVKIQEMIVLHDKVYIDQAKPSPSPVKPIEPVKSEVSHSLTTDQLVPKLTTPSVTRPPRSDSPSSTRPPKTESPTTTRPPNTESPVGGSEILPITPAPSSSNPLQRRPVQLITKLVSMTPQENGYIYRNKEIVEQLINEFPGSSIEYSLYENDNISVTAPAESINKVHKKVVDGVRSAIENKPAFISSFKEVLNPDPAPENKIKIPEPASTTTAGTSPGRLSAELDSYRTASPSPPPASLDNPPPTISFDTSAELRTVEGYNPTAKRHQHRVLSPITQTPGPPPGYSDTESVHSDKPDGAAAAPNGAQLMTSTSHPHNSPTSVTRLPKSESPSVSFPTNLDASWPLPSASVIRPSNTSLPARTSPNVNSPTKTRPPNSESPHSTRPPNFNSIPLPCTRPPNSVSETVPSTRPPTAASNPAIIPPDTMPLNFNAIPNLRPPNPVSEFISNTLPPNTELVPVTGPSNAESVPVTRPPSTESLVPKNTIGSPANPTPLLTNTMPASRPPQSEPSSSTNGTAYNLHNLNRNLMSNLFGAEESIAPNDISWEVLRKIPAQIPGMEVGSPEEWMYRKLRERITTGLVASILITELVQLFVTEFSVNHTNASHLTGVFYKCLKSKSRIFSTKVLRLQNGKKNIDVSLNLPKRLTPKTTPSVTSLAAPDATSATRTSPLATPVTSTTPVASTPPLATPAASTTSLATPPLTTTQIPPLAQQSPQLTNQSNNHVAIPPNLVQNQAQNLVAPNDNMNYCQGSQPVSSNRESNRTSSLTVYPNFEDMLCSPPSDSVTNSASSEQPVEVAEESGTESVDNANSQLVEQPQDVQHESDSSVESAIPDEVSIPSRSSTISEPVIPSADQPSKEPILDELLSSSEHKLESQVSSPSTETEAQPQKPSPDPPTLRHLTLSESDNSEQQSPDSGAPPVNHVIDRTRSEHSSGSDYVICGKSESGSAGSDGQSSVVLLDSPLVRSGADSSSAIKEEKLDETFTKLNISSEEEQEEEEDEDHYTTFFSTSRRTLCSIGAVGDSTYLNINATQPSWILVDGGDVPTKNSIMKQIVNVWVNLKLPVFVVSPKLETVSSHPNVGFYQFRTLTGTEDPELISRCEEFLTSEMSLKLLVINTTHQAMDTNQFLTVLAEQYDSFNVVVLTIAPHQDVDTLTGLITTWKRKLKRDTDSVLDDISQTFEITFGPEVEQIKRGTLVSVSLDEDDIQPVVFTSLFGK